MSDERSSGTQARVVRCVTKDISPDDLGVTMHHEHLFFDLSWAPDRGLPATQRAGYYAPVTLATRHRIDRHHANLDDRIQLDVPLAIAEILAYREAGGMAIVDATPIGLGRDPAALRQVAEATGLNIIMGAGYYVEHFHPREVATLTVDELTTSMVSDIIEGDEQGIRAGFLGEIGMSHPSTPGEEKVLRAAARASAVTGAALMVHPGRNPKSPGEHLDLIAREGGDVKRVIMAHTDRTLFSHEERRDLADRGCFVAFDLFGRESSFYSMAPIDMPNDAARIDAIRDLFDAGYGSQVLISQDICYKTGLEQYGGPGYSHILRNVIPMMRRKGFTAEDVHELLVKNPERAFSFCPPDEVDCAAD